MDDLEKLIAALRSQSSSLIEVSNLVGKSGIAARDACAKIQNEADRVGIPNVEQALENISLGYSKVFESRAMINEVRKDIKTYQALFVPLAPDAVEMVQVDDLDLKVRRPKGVPAGWICHRSKYRDGWTWRASKGRPHPSVRIMGPTWNDGHYPFGYVRFYNEHGRPVSQDGQTYPKDDPCSRPHFERSKDGSYDLPEGWPYE